MMTIDDTSVELGTGRIEVGQYIKVLPTPGNPKSFIGRIQGWWITEAGEITAVDVWGDGRRGRQRMRSLRPNQVVVLSARMQNKLLRADEARRNGE